MGGRADDIRDFFPGKASIGLRRLLDSRAGAAFPKAIFPRVDRAEASPFRPGSSIEFGRIFREIQFWRNAQILQFPRGSSRLNRCFAPHWIAPALATSAQTARLARFEGQKTNVGTHSLSSVPHSSSDGSERSEPGSRHPPSRPLPTPRLFFASSRYLFE
jgi:hypothetical protein